MSSEFSGDVAISDPDTFSQLMAIMFDTVNLKIFMVTILIVSFLITTFAKESARSRDRHWHRTNVQSWSTDKLNKCKELIKKGMDIKNFDIISEGDLDNITLINTLINTYDNETYEVLTGKKV